MHPLLLSVILLGQAATTPVSAAKLYGPNVPEQGILTLKTARYAVSFCAQQAWTVYKIEYEGKTVAHERGFYGTVMTPKGDKWWGTGHTEGGREIVHSLKLLLDGRQRPVETGKTFTGRSLTLSKDSTIWKFKCLAEVAVTDDHLTARTQLEATEDVELSRMYYFMHCFLPTTTRWIAESPGGEQITGEFRNDGGFQVNRDTRWVAEFEPAMKLGFLAYMPKVIHGPGSMSKIWDRTNYHKLYCQANTARLFKQGEKLDYRIVVQMVPQETGDWSATKTAVEALKKLYPPQ